MLLRLIITQGPRQGEELVIRGSVTLGRSKGDFALQDSKASSNHARIFTNDEGVIVIEDLGSRNGTRVNGERVQSAALNPGDTIAIGKTVFEVKAEAAVEGQNAAEKGTWQEIIEMEFAKCLETVESKPIPPSSWAPFKQALKLEFVQGLQSGTTLTYGFGPREIGKLCPDGLLFDSQAPDVAFSIHPDQTELGELRTSLPTLLINDKVLKPQVKKKGVFTQKLKNGDRISFGQTVILVTAL